MRISPGVEIPDAQIGIAFGPSRGPGGQNVNKVATAAILTFDVPACAALSDAQKAAILQSLRRRISTAGILRLRCDEHRAQPQNRREVMRRFAALLELALRPPTPRHKTRPTHGSKVRRLTAKRHRSARKRERRGPGDAD